MGLLALIAWAALAVPQDVAAEAPPVVVSVPPALASPQPAPGLQGAPEPASAPAAPLGIPAQDPPRNARALEDRPEAGPSVSGYVVGFLLVVVLLGGALLLLRRFGKGSRFLGAGGPIRVLARKSLGPKQELFLVEIGSRVLVVGSTREQLSALGEFSGPDEVAALRASLSPRGEESQRAEFRDSLREGLRDQEAPREERLFRSIADELAELRKTVRAWRA